MVPVARFMASQVCKEVREIAQQSIVIASPSPSPSLHRSSLSEDYWKKREPMKYSWQKLKKQLSLSRSEDRGTLSRRESIKSKHKSSSSNEGNDMSAPKQDLTHQRNVAFTDDVNYSTYGLRNCSQKCYEKLAARTAKLAKHMETIMNAYKFEDLGPVAILSVLWQFKGACDYNIL